MLHKIKHLFKSQIHRKIMLFFVENEGSVDTPRGFSAWTNEDIKKVTEALEELVSAGLIKAHRTSSTVGYSCALGKKQLHLLTSKFNI